MSNQVGSISGRLLRFAIVGLISNVCLLAAFFALTEKGMPPVWASIAVYAVGVLATYVLHRGWSFRADTPHHFSGPRYLLTHAMGAFIQSALLVLGHDWLGFDLILVQASAMIIVAMIVFIVLNFFTFISSSTPRLASSGGSRVCPTSPS